MSFENFNPFKKKENRYLSDKEKEEKRKKKEDDEFDPGRREFLKKAGAAAGGVILSGSLGTLLWEKMNEEEKEPGKERMAKKEEPPEPTPEQEKIEEENVTSLSEVLDFEKEGRIELNEETMEAIKNYWKEQYKKNPDLRNSLVEGYEQMGEWEPYLKEQFRQAGIPERYIYLALPESHWQLEARSPVGAVGPYQFMPDTARKYGLKTDYFADQPSNLDERKDPVQAAEACAHLLKDLYVSSKDWDLALSGYNGGYIWHYLNNAYENNENISYSDFLGYLEEKINNIKEEIKAKEYEEYKIQKGDTLQEVASKFNMEVEELCRINNIKDKNRIFVGQTLQIPITENTKKKIFEDKISGMSENLNYPHKFNAVYELIEEEFADQQEEPVSFKTVKAESGYTTHTFSEKDKTIYSLAQRYPGVDVKQILKANPDLDPKKLKPGTKLRIPDENASNTLEDISRTHGVDLERLNFLNPAVEEADKSIPKGYKIRVPAS